MFSAYKHHSNQVTNPIKIVTTDKTINTNFTSKTRTVWSAYCNEKTRKIYKCKEQEEEEEKRDWIHRLPSESTSTQLFCFGSTLFVKLNKEKANIVRFAILK